MAGISVKFKMLGVEQIDRKLKTPDIFREPLRKLFSKGAMELEREVKMATPVGTPESTGKRGYIGGRLRASMTTRVDASPVPLWAEVGTRVKYASFVELGTEKMAARHIEYGKRVYGKGMFAYAVEKLKGKIDNLLAEAKKILERNFSK